MSSHVKVFSWEYCYQLLIDYIPCSVPAVAKSMQMHEGLLYLARQYHNVPAISSTIRQPIPENVQEQPSLSPNARFEPKSP